MKIILSPSKKMEVKKLDIVCENKIKFYEKTKFLVEELKVLNVEKIMEILKIKNDMAIKVKRLYENWGKESGELGRYAYKGTAYKGLDALLWSEENLIYARERLFILSALYGVVGVDDIIFEYRLDMNSKLKINDKSLYSYWRDELEFFFKEIAKEEVVINLASNEFYKMVNFKKIGVEVITPIFKEKKENGYKAISYHSKIARGKMANYIIKNRVESLEELKKYNLDLYSYSRELSSGEELIFIRDIN